MNQAHHYPQEKINKVEIQIKVEITRLMKDKLSVKIMSYLTDKKDKKKAKGTNKYVIKRKLKFEIINIVLKQCMQKKLTQIVLDKIIKNS